MNAGLNEVLDLDNGHARPSYPLVGKRNNGNAHDARSSQIIVDPPRARVKRFIVPSTAEPVKAFSEEKTARRSPGEPEIRISKQVPNPR
jgi:hypothetical protein